MLASCPVIGFIPVRSLEQAEHFYVNTLGLKRRQNDGFALVLEAANGIMVRCVVTDSHPLPFTIFGWEVPDIAAAVKDLHAAGVQPIIYPHFQQGSTGVWTAPTGDKVVWFNDPFSNVLSLSQHTGT